MALYDVKIDSQSDRWSRPLVPTELEVLGPKAMLGANEYRRRLRPKTINEVAWRNVLSCHSTWLVDPDLKAIVRSLTARKKGASSNHANPINVITKHFMKWPEKGRKIVKTRPHLTRCVHEILTLMRFSISLNSSSITLRLPSDERHLIRG